jgi:hypothetical protein
MKKKNKIKKGTLLPSVITTRKSRDMILDATEMVLGYSGFDRSIYGNFKKNKEEKKWYEELR